MGSIDPITSCFEQSVTAGLNQVVVQRGFAIPSQGHIFDPLSAEINRSQSTMTGCSSHEKGFDASPTWKPHHRRDLYRQWLSIGKLNALLISRSLLTELTALGIVVDRVHRYLRCSHDSTQNLLVAIIVPLVAVHVPRTARGRHAAILELAEIIRSNVCAGVVF